MATSGAMSTSNQYVKYTISITQNSQNVTGNSSNVTVSVRFYRTNTGYTTYGSGTLYCKVNGTTYSATVTSDQKITSSGIVLFSSTFNIPHNSDGSKTLTVSAWINLNTPLTSNEQSFSQVLTTIPRATTPTVNVARANMGTSITVSMPRASASFTHTLRYVFGNQTGTIGSGLGTSTTWTIPLSLANVVPNATEGILIIYCDTYNGSTKIGTKSVNVTAVVPSSVVPTISSVSVAEGVAGIASKFGAFVKNQSKLNVTISAAGSYSSSIASCISTVCGKSYNGTSFTVETVNLCETVNIQTTVTDSRGRTATYTKAVTVLEYAAPTISSFTVQRCNQNGTLNDEGEYLRIAYNYAITALNNRNDKSCTIAYKRDGDASYTTLKTESLYTNNLTYTTTVKFSGDYAYNVRITIDDYFRSATYEIEVPTAFTLVDYHSSGRGIAFGKVAERSNAMEIALDMYDKYDKKILNGLAHYGGSIRLDPNTTLEELILTDNDNAPETGFFYIRTLFYSTKSTTANRSQVAIPYNSAGGIWYRYFYNGSWSTWRTGERDTGWIDLTLSSGWTFQYSGDKPQYRRIGNIVYLRGLIDATSAAAGTIATLPAGFRPLGSFVRFTCSLNQTEYANVQVNNNGVINDHQKGTKTRTFLCLAGISFPVG